MSDKEKFEGFKRELIEKKRSFMVKKPEKNMVKKRLTKQIQKLMGLSEADYERFKNLEKEDLSSAGRSCEKQRTAGK